MQQLQQKYTTLAQAIPQEKYSWRPAEGVRSINELFLHVAGAGFYFPTLKGTPAAPGFTPKDFEKSTTDKAKVIEWLNKSFTYAIASVQSMSNAQFAAPVPKLGPQANEGDVVYLMVVHAHEHLGQACSFCGPIPSVVIQRSEATRNLSSSRLKQQENSRCMRYVQPAQSGFPPFSTLSHRALRDLGGTGRSS